MKVCVIERNRRTLTKSSEVFLPKTRARYILIHTANAVAVPRRPLGMSSFQPRLTRLFNLQPLIPSILEYEAALRRQLCKPAFVGQTVV